jgi:hypothetical protein
MLVSFDSQSMWLIYESYCLSICVYSISGIASILGKGVPEYARTQILVTPTYEPERSKFKLSQRTRSEHNYTS